MKINQPFPNLSKDIINTNLNKDLIQDPINQSLSISSNSFAQVLSTSKSCATQETLLDLVNKIEKQTKSIIKNPCMQNISIYREYVKEFVGIAASNYECSSLDLYSDHGYRKSLTGSSVIDDKLESIVNDFISNNKLSLESISLLSDIKGLLIDVVI